MQMDCAIATVTSVSACSTHAFVLILFTVFSHWKVNGKPTPLASKNMVSRVSFIDGIIDSDVLFLTITGN